MNTIAAVKEVKRHDLSEVFKHLSVQSLLEMKSLYGRVCEDDLINLLIASTKSFCVTDGARSTGLFFFVRTAQNTYNMFLLFTSRLQKCYNSIEEDIIGSFPDGEINAIAYNGDNIEQGILVELGFKKVDGEEFMSVEGKRHTKYRRQ